MLNHQISISTFYMDPAGFFLCILQCILECDILNRCVYEETELDYT